MSSGRKSGQIRPLSHQDPRVVLSRVLTPDMSFEEVAIQALSGIEFASLEASRDALRNVAAAVEIMTIGPVRPGPVLVSG